MDSRVENHTKARPNLAQSIHARAPASIRRIMGLRPHSNAGTRNGGISILAKWTHPMTLWGAIRKVSPNDRWLQITLLAFMVLYYGVLLCDPGLHKPTPTLLFKADPQELTFNSMLAHLAHGQFDVDPNTVKDEGFLRNGHVYAYWGITCALLRLPLLLFHRMDLNVTAWSCLIAVCLAGIMKVRAVLFLRRHCGPTPDSEWAFGLMLAYVILGGAGVGYLKSSIYQEVIFWAIAFAAVFVYFAVRGLVSGEFTTVTLSWMAFAAGLALLTRASTGMGLYAAFALLLLVLLVKEFRARRTLFTLRILIPIAVLAAFLIVVGTVNYYRWGKPTTFVDLTLYLQNAEHPDRLLRMQLYGSFNLARVPFGLGYYFLPLWALQGTDGRLLFENTQTRLMDFVELPPSSFFLTDLLPIAFIVFLAMALWARRQSLARSLRTGWGFAQGKETQPPFRIFSPAQGLALATGLAVPCVLMLTFTSMSYRYRMEFYPEIDLLAFLGLYATVSDSAMLARFNRCRRWMLAAAMISIVLAFVVMILYKLSVFGPAREPLSKGIVHYYLQSASHRLLHARQ